MTVGLRALLSQVIDYAGLFPPAQLPLDQSIRNYARYRTEPQSWMLGRFICPASRLRELEPFVAELFSHPNDLLCIAALGRGGTDASEFITGFGRDMQAIVEFEQQFGQRVAVQVMETRLPAEADVTFDFDSERLALYFEPAPGDDWRRAIDSAIRVARSAERRCGMKLRTGGVEPAAFPPLEQVAYAIAACRDNDVPLKFTAGLHHPMRHFNASMNCRMHGFINVFLAGVLAHTKRLEIYQLISILADEDAGNFAFDEQGAGWKDHRATTQQIESVRRNRVISFGSCSFDEPRDDLRELGWL